MSFLICQGRVTIKTFYQLVKALIDLFMFNTICQVGVDYSASSHSRSSHLQVLGEITVLEKFHRTHEKIPAMENFLNKFAGHCNFTLKWV